MIRFGIDIDGVLCDVSVSFLKEIQKSHPEVREFTGLDGLSEVLKNELIFSPKYYFDAPVYDGAREFLQALQERGSVYLITARPKSLEGVTRDWLHDKGLVFDYLIMSRDKGAVVEYSCIDFFLDDDVVNVREASRFCQSFLMRRSWNAGVSCRSVGSYTEFLGLL